MVPALVLVVGSLLGSGVVLAHLGNPVPLHISLLLGASVPVILFVTRQPLMLGITTVPLFGWSLARFVADSPLAWACVALLGVALAVSALQIRRLRLMTHTDRARRKIKLWRFLARPAAMAFPVLLLVAGRTFTLVLLGAVFAVFLGLDIARLSAGRVNLFLFRRARSTFKDSERNRLSSMTGFLLAMFAVMLVFDRTTAWYAIAFLVFGDFAAKYFGLQYGRTRLFRKTLEGSLGHLLACIAAGFIIHQYLPLPVPVVLLGALVATVFEMLPLGIDDNLVTALAAATTMNFTRGLLG
jgi:glycerol-3-phosphate acyltransferase PlsY